LVGTAALLGEGWDSPCLNTLVLASFVASYVLSNQMRGRAIRIDPGQPDKTANIWHLATVEPPQADLGTADLATAALDQPAGHDFAAVARRFDGFFGPAYDQPYITSGIRRLSIIQPPFDQDGVAQINRQMERRAADRTDLAARWRGAADQTRRPEVAEVVAAPSLPLAFVFHDLLALLVVAFVLIDLPLMFGQTGLKALAKAGREGASGGVLALGLIVAICGLLIWIGVKFGRRIAAYFSPRRSAAALARALLTTLVQTGQIASDQATVTIAAAAAGHRVEFALLGASTRDKAVFAAAAADMLRPIKQPRYLAIRRRPWGGHQASASFAAPAAVSTAAAAAIFQRELARRLGRFDLVYTQNVAGRRLLLKCRRRSYINRNARIVEHIQRVAYTI
jgi:hypothetical protein